MPLKYRHYLLVLLVYILIFVIYFYPVLLGGGLIFYSDGSLSDFYTPAQLWSNEYFAGHPVFAAPEKQYSYPLRYLFAALPQSLGYNMFVLSGYVLSAWLTYCYCHHLSQSVFAAFAGGLIFGLSGFMMINVDHLSMIQATAWMPLLLWSLHQLSQTYSRRWFFVCVLATTLSILSGHPQITFYTMLLAGVYVLVLSINAKGGAFRFCVICSAAALLGLMLSAVEIIPMVELGQSSTKQSMSYEVFSSYAFPANQMAQLFFPFIYGGPVESIYGGPFFGLANSRGIVGSIGFLAVIMAVFGVIRHLKNNIDCRFWFGALIVSFVLATGDSTPVFRLAYELPLFNLFRAHGRLMMIVSIATAVLATFGLASLQRKALSLATRSSVVIAFSGMVLGLLLWTVSGQLYQTYSGNLSSFVLSVPLVLLGLSSLIVLLWRKPLQNRSLKSLLILFLVIDLTSANWFFPWHYKTLSVDFLKPDVHHLDYKKQLEQQHHRFAAMDGFWSKVITPDQARIFDIETVNGYGPLQMTEYQRFSGITNSGNFTPQLFEFSNRTLDLLSVSLVSSPEPIDNAQSRFELLEQVEGSFIYRNRRVLPRAWLATEIIVQDRATMLRTIKTSRLPNGLPFDPLTMALVEEKVEFKGANNVDKEKNMEVTINSLSNHKIELSTDNHYDAFLVLSENYSAGWQAAIDGKQHPLTRTSVSLRGLVLPAGKHQVVLTYEPFSLWIGAFVSFMGLFLCGVVAVVSKNKRLQS